MNMKQWYQSKTLWFNILVGLIFLIDLITAQKLIPADVLPYVIIGTSFINYILRTYFTQEKVRGGILKSKQEQW